jgi:hypothetical protein
MIKRLLLAATPLALGAGLMATALASTTTDASAAGLRYNCQNGPELTVVFEGDTLQYVYDGDESAMRTMRVSPKSPRRFIDGTNSITLQPNRATVVYREANFSDRCTAYHGF